MKSRIFYSWQSDIKAAACRTLIADALAGSARALVEDGTIEIVPVIDRDTLDVPGCPDIGSTIFAKIDSADAFVADVTIVGRISGGRPTPNPNVLVELGYALKAVGENRVVLVQNLAFGGPELLPFDLRQKRVVTYSSDTASNERSAVRRQLVIALKLAISSIVATRPGSGGSVDADPRITRWRELLKTATTQRTWVEFETAIEVDLGVTTASGRTSTTPALLDGFVNIHSVAEYEFSLGFPVRGRGGVSVVAIPFGQVEDLWPGSDGKLHVLLKRALLLKGDTSSFV
jgi:hypothetical protein